MVPTDFTFRSSQTHRDARTFIEHHGTHEPLPADAFTPSGITVATRMAQLTKALTGGRAEHLNPDESGLTGPIVGLCPACGATDAGRDTAAAQARTHGATPAVLTEARPRHLRAEPQLHEAGPLALGAGAGRGCCPSILADRVLPRKTHPVTRRPV